MIAMDPNGVVFAFLILLFVTVIVVGSVFQMIGYNQGVRDSRRMIEAREKNFTKISQEVASGKYENVDELIADLPNILNEDLEEEEN